MPTPDSTTLAEQIVTVQTAFQAVMRTVEKILTMTSMDTSQPEVADALDALDRSKASVDQLEVGSFLHDLERGTPNADRRENADG